MAHEHLVRDVTSDFTIDYTSREITATESRKLKLVQYDHNSEAVLFECPRFIEGHDMSYCDKIEVHFVNASTGVGTKGVGIYRVTDARVSPDDEEKLLFTWLISRNATENVGTLVFSVRFTCLTENELDYVWHTIGYNYISVEQGLVNELDPSYTDVYLDNLETMAEDRIDEITKEKFNDAVAALEESLAKDVAQLQTDLAVERERISTLASLSEGSTTGDAELIDIRIGYKGTTYTNAGEAVRSQMHQVLEDCCNEIDSSLNGRETLVDSIVQGGYCIASGHYVETQNGYCTDYISVSGYTTIYYASKLTTTGAILAFYGDGKYDEKLPDYNVTGIHDTIQLTQDTGTISIPKEAKYVRLSSYNDPDAYMILRSESLVKQLGQKITGKNIMFFGDSITASSEGYVQYMLDNGLLLSANFAVSGAEWRNAADTILDGTPVAGTSSNTMCNQVKKLLNDTSLYKTPDIIVLSAGTNDDYYDEVTIDSQFTGEQTGTSYIDIDSCDLTSFAGAVRWCVEKLMETYPDADIFIAGPIQGAQDVRPYWQQKSKSDRLEELAGRLSVGFIDALGKSGIYGRYEVNGEEGKYLKDGLHPNADGVIKLGAFYMKELSNHYTFDE